MQVHNINGTSDNECVCGSWKNHWIKYNEKGQEWPVFCSEKDCTCAPTVGAHVQKEIGKDMSWFIIPLCARHNGPKFHGKTITISDSTSFASANRSETCEKSK